MLAHSLIRLCAAPPSPALPHKGGEGFLRFILRQCRISTAAIPAPSPSSPGLSRGSTSWQRSGSQDVGGRTKSGHDVEGVCCSGDVNQPAPVGPEPLGSEPLVRSRVARRAARLDDACVLMEEPGGRFAHGFFRRTGDAGSVTARGGDRKVSGGLDPIPIQRHTAWASRRHAPATDMHGTVPAPTLRRLASAPLVRSRSCARV